MHIDTVDAKVNEIQWKLLPIGFQSVYQSVQIEKGFCWLFSTRYIYSLITKTVITKPKILPLHVYIQAQGLPQLSLKLMPLFVENAFGSSAKVLFASD